MNAATAGPGRHLGVDVGGTKTYAVVTDAAGTIVGESTIATPQRAGDAAVVEAIVSAGEQARQAAGLAWDDVASIGVGAPGQVDVTAGTWSGSTNVLLDAPPLALTSALTARTARPAFVENDVRAAAYGEYRCGVGVGRQDTPAFVYISVGTGLAASVILDGALYRGRGESAELGHIVVNPNGFPCACGQRGCLETVASGRALERWGRDVVAAGWSSLLLEASGGDPAGVSGQLVHECAVRGDPLALDLMARLAHGIGLSVLIAMRSYDPDVIVLGGGVIARGGDLLLDATAEAIDRIRSAGLDRRKAERDPDSHRIIRSSLGWRAGGIGAALIGERGVAGRA